MYNYRTAKVRVEHEIRLVLRGDLTVADAAEHIMVIAKMWKGDLEQDADNKIDSSHVPEMRVSSEGVGGDT